MDAVSTDARSADRRAVDQPETAAANRSWWDGEAGAYYAEHGGFLGDSDFVWGPEGLREAEAGLLGDVSGARVLEIGAGAAQCSRYLAGRNARVVATDLSAAMLRQGVALNAKDPLRRVPLVQCDGLSLPFGDAVFEVVFTAYGVVPFVADSDRRPYVEEDDHGRATYVEHHRTLGDRVREVTAAGLRVLDVVEPEWPEANTQTWGGWSPMRGRLIPGTAIFVTEKPD